MRDYKKEYREYHGTSKQKKLRALRNKANRKLSPGSGKEVDHKVPLSKGGSNGESNWRVVSRSTNRKKYDKTAAEKIDWDAVLLAAGGAFSHADGAPLLYNDGDVDREAAVGRVSSTSFLEPPTAVTARLVVGRTVAVRSEEAGWVVGQVLKRVYVDVEGTRQLRCIVRVDDSEDDQQHELAKESWLCSPAAADDAPAGTWCFVCTAPINRRAVAELASSARGGAEPMEEEEEGEGGGKAVAQGRRIHNMNPFCASALQKVMLPHHRQTKLLSINKNDH